MANTKKKSEKRDEVKDEGKKSSGGRNYGKRAQNSGKDSKGRKNFKNDNGQIPSDKDPRFDCRNERNTGSTNPENPWQWYARNEEMLNASANIVYSRSAGIPFTKNVNGKTFVLDGAENAFQPYTVSTGPSESFPGIMVLRTIPTPGMSTSPTSPLNIYIRDIYSFVRKHNSGARNYEAPDIGIYLIGVQSIVALFSHVIRLYGMLRTYSQQNRFWPESILRAVGLSDPAEAQANMADFNFRLNQLLVKFTTIRCPDCDLFSRAFWMYSNIYSDGATPKSQNYAFVPKGYFKYEPRTAETGGCLRYREIPLAEGSSSQYGMRYTQWCDLLDELISAYMYDEDHFNVISGDVEKAYEGKGLIMLPLVSQDYTVAPVYEMTTLYQITNAVCTGLPQSSTNTLDPDIDGLPEEVAYRLKAIARMRTMSNDPDFAENNIYQMDGHLYYMPLFATQCPTATSVRLLNVDKEYPEPKDTIEATRLMTCPDFELQDPDEANIWYQQYSALPCDFVTDYSIYGNIRSEDGTKMFAVPNPDAFGGEDNNAILTSFYQVEGVAKAVAVLNLGNKLTKFDWAPKMYWSINQELEGGEMNIFGDVQTFATIEDSLKPMHETALMSLLGIPSRW